LIEYMELKVPTKFKLQLGLQKDRQIPWQNMTPAFYLLLVECPCVATGSQFFLRIIVLHTHPIPIIPPICSVGLLHRQHICHHCVTVFFRALTDHLVVFISLDFRMSIG
jgi:hypothetical protein